MPERDESQSTAQDRDAKGRFLRPDGTSAASPCPSGPSAPRRRRAPSAVKHFRVDECLTDPAERAEYERLLHDPNSTAESLKQWLVARGHKVCKNAVQRHRRHFNADLKRLRECSKMADAFCTLSRKHGAGSIAEANQSKFEMELMMNLFKLQDASKAPPEYWQQMSRALAGMVATRRSVEEMRTDFDAKAKAAVKEAQKLDPSEHGKRIAERVAEILGA
jgi:hypothetical protein